LLKFCYLYVYAETIRRVSSLLLYKSKINIMKKTILMVAVVFMSIVTGVKANESNLKNNDFITEIVDVKTFCKAIMQGDIETVKKLIDLGEDVNKKSLGMTPAIFAARYNRVEILKLLIDRGANLKTKSDKGLTVMKQAKLSKAMDVVTYLKSLS